MAVRLIGKVLGALGTCVAVQACVSVDEVQVMPGVFELAMPASGFTNSEERARVILKLRAGDLCPNGYDLLRESRIVDGQEIETMTWRIACRKSGAGCEQVSPCRANLWPIVYLVTEHHGCESSNGWHRHRCARAYPQ